MVRLVYSTSCPILQEPSTAKVSPTASSLLTKLIEASFTCVAACKTPTIKPAINAANSAGPAIRQQTKNAFRKSSTAPSVVMNRSRRLEISHGGREDGRYTRFLGRTAVQPLASKLA